MSVNDKMTAIAEKIRFYTETEDKLSLDEIKNSIDKVNEIGKNFGYKKGINDFANTTYVSGVGEVVAQNVHSVTHDIEISVQSDILDSVEITRKGKNLFDGSLILKASGWTFENGYYSGKATALRNFYHPNYQGNSFVSGFKPNTQYTLSFRGYNDSDGAIATLGFFFKYSDGTISGEYLETNRSEILFRLVSKAGKSIVGLYATFSATSPKIFLKDIQVEEGNAPTPYTPYSNDIYKANETGIIEGIKSISPIMYFTSNDPQSEIRVNYILESIH